MVREILSEFRHTDFSTKSLRSFGLMVGAILLALMGWILWPDTISAWLAFVRKGTVTGAISIGLVGIVLIVFGIVIPRALRPLYWFWMFLATIMGFIMTRVILTLVFLIVVTPTGIVMKLLGKDVLDRKIDRSKESYWVHRDDADWSPERLEKYY